MSRAQRSCGSPAGAIILLALCLQGCSSSPGTLVSRLTEQGRLLADSAPASMTPAAISKASSREVPVLYEFAIQARAVQPGMTSLGEQQAALAALTAPQWANVTRAGQAYIDTQCLAFVGALHDLERAKKATLADLNAIGSATVGIMGLARAAQQSIGYVGVGFGLVSSLFDTTVSAYLYQLPASGVASIVAAQRDVLRMQDSAVLSQIQTQSDANARLSEYIQYCVPVTIEANIGRVLAAARARGTSIETSAVTPAVTSALAHGQPFLQTSAARDLVAARVAALDPQHALEVARILLPRLATRQALTQARLQPQLARPGGPLANPARATMFLNLWVQTEIMTSENEAEWLAALDGTS